MAAYPEPTPVIPFSESLAAQGPYVRLPCPGLARARNVSRHWGFPRACYRVRDKEDPSSPKGRSGLFLRFPPGPGWNKQKTRVSRAQLQVTRGGNGQTMDTCGEKGNLESPPSHTVWGGRRERAFARVRGANRNEEWTRGSGPSCVSILCVYPVCLSCLFILCLS
jgi:hypothetical protein